MDLSTLSYKTTLLSIGRVVNMPEKLGKYNRIKLWQESVLTGNITGLKHSKGTRTQYYFVLTCYPPQSVLKET
jgi:hypothetical protein